MCVMIMGGNGVMLPSGGTVDVLVSTSPTGKKSSQHSSLISKVCTLGFSKTNRKPLCF